MSTQNEAKLKKLVTFKANANKILKRIYKLHYLKNGVPNRSIIVTTGGTGGHIVPAMKIASNLILQGRTVYFITDKRFKRYEGLFLNKRFFFSPNFKIITTPISSFSHSTSIAQFIKNLLVTIFKIILTLIKARPKIIIGFGSYVSFLPLLLGLLTFRKIIVHEQNVLFGKVNKFFAPFANSVLLSFPDTSYIPKKLYKRIRNKLVISGFPSFLPDGVWNRSSGKVIYDLATKEEVTILVTGGGQGASFFSHTIPPAITFLAKSFPHKKFNVYHQIRKGEIEKALELYKKGGATNIYLEIKPIFEDIPSILLKSDIAIIRGGAGSIIEVALSKVFPIIIPMPDSADNHQVKNAMMLTNNNAGVMFNQADCTPQKLAMVLCRTISDSLFYFPIVNNAFEIFKINPNQVFSNVILYNDLESLHIYD